MKRDLPLIPFKSIKYKKVPIVMVFHDISSFSLFLIIRYLKSFKCEFMSLAELINVYRSF